MTNLSSLAIAEDLFHVSSLAIAEDLFHVSFTVGFPEKPPRLVPRHPSRGEFRDSELPSCRVRRKTTPPRSSAPLKRGIRSLPTSPTPYLLTAHCSLLTAHCSLLTAHCSLLTAHCSLRLLDHRDIVVHRCEIDRCNRFVTEFCLHTPSSRDASIGDDHIICQC